MAFDLRTLSLIAALACVAFAFATFTVAKMHPHVLSLRMLAIAAAATAFGNLFLGLRGFVPDWLSIVVGNALLVMGLGYIYVGLRGLLGYAMRHVLPATVAVLALGSLPWFTYMAPSVPARIVICSLLFLPSFALLVWMLVRHDRRVNNDQLRLMNRITLVLCVVGFLITAARIAPAARVMTDASYTVSNSSLVIGLYLWGIAFNVWMSVMVTITVSIRLREQLAAARDRAEAANVAKSRFLATMSHEIRTPMNGILGMAQLMQQPQMSVRERQEAATTILHSGQTLMTLLNDILDLSKVEAGKFELSPVRFTPVQLMRDIETLFSGSARANGLKMSSQWCGVGSGDNAYLGDATRLRQMLSNLVGNALKFTREGEVRIEARLVADDSAADDGGSMLEFSVIDTGIGIPPEKQALVFQAFSQADNSVTREFGGTGLGLSIVQTLSKLMGGAAGLESTMGQGSRFWFRARVAAAPAVDTNAETDTHAQQQVFASSENAPLVSPSADQTPRVLVVEDHPVNRTVVVAMLGRLGIEALLAEDGEAGVAMRKAHPEISLILMDVQMPVLDGYGATRRIREWETIHDQRRMPIIALTADAYEEDKQRSLASGMDDFLSKPVNFKELQTMLERWQGT